MRLKPQERAELEAGAERLGYKTLGAFFIAAAQRVLLEGQQESELRAFEDRMAASFNHLASLVTTVNDGLQVNIAQVDTLARSFYTCVPEPAPDVHEAAVASARLRHARFVRHVKKDATGIE